MRFEIVDVSNYKTSLFVSFRDNLILVMLLRHFNATGQHSCV